jgi:hypothetical protein
MWQAQVWLVPMRTSPSAIRRPMIRPWICADPQIIHELLKHPLGPMISFPRVSTGRETAS